MIENRGTVRFRLIIPWLIACLVLSLALGCAAEGTAPKGKIGEPKPTVWDRIWDKVTAKSGAEIDILRGSPVVQVTVPEERAIYTFTKPPHPAHPAVVRRVLVEEGGTVSVATEGWAAGSQEAFQRWLETFADQDEALRRRFRDGD